MGEQLQLRDYQQRTLDQLYDWIPKYEGNPCIVLPTGAGKSIIIAALCKDAINNAKDTRIMMLTHQKELIEQDFEKLMNVWPSADAGVYSAMLGRKELHNQVTFASIQSIYRHANEVGKVDIIIIDEAHLINHEDTGMYRAFIDDLKKINKELRCIGLTATPYRLKHGLITDKPALFNQPLIEPVTIKELQDLGFLCPLTSKSTKEELNVDGVRLTAGDFNNKQLQEAVDIPGKTEAVVKEVIARSNGRKSWLFFCSGISHAINTRDILRANGISAECVTGATPKSERENILREFRLGHITAVTNANVLTTGFDNTRIDLIAMLRPTMSPGLYVQMVGRGLRVDSNKRDCLILDFAGNVMRHGPIHNVQPPNGRRRKGIAPSKVCPKCMEIIAMNARVCPCCEYVFPVQEPKEKTFQLNDADINGITERVMFVSRWQWTKTRSKAGNPMIQVRYYPKDLLKQPINEFLLIWSENEWVRSKSIERLRYLAEQSHVHVSLMNAVEFCNQMNMRGKVPFSVSVKLGSKYPVVTDVFWER